MYIKKLGVEFWSVFWAFKNRLAGSHRESENFYDLGKCKSLLFRIRRWPKESTPWSVRYWIRIHDLFIFSTNFLSFFQQKRLPKFWKKTFSSVNLTKISKIPGQFRGQVPQIFIFIFSGQLILGGWGKGFGKMKSSVIHLILYIRSENRQSYFSTTLTC